jgi:hypothetical protein
MSPEVLPDRQRITSPCNLARSAARLLTLGDGDALRFSSYSAKQSLLAVFDVNLYRKRAEA